MRILATADHRSRLRLREFCLLIGATALLVAVFVWSRQALGTRSVAFAFVIVWLPMTWLGTVSHFVDLRLPGGYHALRGFERGGRIYEWFGIRSVKRLLRRGPVAVFNPGLRLPATRTPQTVAELAGRMCRAETSHAIAFVLALAIAVHAAARGWWLAAGSTLLFDLLVNGYPIMLQRYNRALLATRVVDAPTSSDPRLALP